METSLALLALATGEFPTQRPVTGSFDVFFDLCPNKQLSKIWWDWWFEMPSHPLWRHCNEMHYWWYQGPGLLKKIAVGIDVS